MFGRPAWEQTPAGSHQAQDSYYHGQPIAVNPQMAQFYSAPAAPAPSNYGGVNFQPPVGYNNHPDNKKEHKFPKRIIAGIAGVALLGGGAFVGYKVVEGAGVIGKEQVISGAECAEQVNDDQSNWFKGGGLYLEAALDEGWIKDSDGTTDATAATPEQREYLRESFNQLSAQFENGYEDSAKNSVGQSGYGNIGYVVFGEGTPTDAEQSDGKINGNYNICVTYGSKNQNWVSLQNEDPNYKIGDVPVSKQ